MDPTASAPSLEESAQGPDQEDSDRGESDQGEVSDQEGDLVEPFKNFGLNPIKLLDTTLRA